MSVSPEWFSNVRGCAPSDVFSRYELGTFALPFHFEMLADSKRVNAFRDAIRELVTSEHVVLDIGTGSGILALLAAERAKRVYAIEMDYSLARIAANNFRRSPHRGKLTLIVGNATQLNMPEKVDVIVCEMMDTVLLNEAQVPIINFARQTMLRQDGVVIPRFVRNSVALANCNFKFYNAVQVQVAHYERPDVSQATLLSETQEYFAADFSKQVPSEVNTRVLLHATQTCAVNAIRLTSIVGLSPSIELDSCPTLNLPIVVPLLCTVDVAKGETVQLKLQYKHFANFNNIAASIER
jgi:predicted RNA methylase